LPPNGWMGNGGGCTMEAPNKMVFPGSAIQWQFAKMCSLQDGAIAHVDGGGLRLRKSCNGNLIQGNRIFDIAANGIVIGGDDLHAASVTSNSVVNNLIQTCGMMNY